MTVSSKGFLYRSFLLLFSLFLMLSAVGCSLKSYVPEEQKSVMLPSKISRIAVISLQREFSGAIEPYFMEALIKKGYDVASRSDLPITKLEIEFQQSADIPKAAAEMGRILAIDAVLLVDITDIRHVKSQDGSILLTNLSMSARLIEVESSRVLWIRSGSSDLSLIELLFNIPMQILFPVENNFDRVSRNILDEFPEKK